MWTLSDGVEVAKFIEKILLAHDLKAHCCLGGSVLHKGWSSKDLDIMIYPHDTGNYDRDKIFDCLVANGFSKDEEWSQAYRGMNSGGEDTEFRVEVFYHQKKRVDIFFL